jgi:glucose/mannose transport system permease protein
MADTYQTQTAGSQWLGRAVLYALLVVFAVYYLMPLFVMVTTSLKTLDDIRAGNLIALPQEISFAAWVKAWGTACTGVECTGLKGNFLNSVSFVVPAVLISTLIGAFNGYVLTMWRFRGSDILFTMLLLGCFIPFQVILLPMAQTLGYLGIANSIAGLIFVHVVYGLAFTTLFFRNFYVTVPSDLSVIWQFTQIWNDFLFGVVFSSGDRQPITVALNNLVNTSTGVKEYNVDMSAAIIAGLPTLFVYIVAGKYFLRGLTAGAVKG